MQDHNDRNYRDLMLALEVSVYDTEKSVTSLYLVDQGITLCVITRQLY